MKIIKVILFCLLFPFCCYAAPSNSISIPNSFNPNTTIVSSEMNSNFNEISNKYSVHTHTDITEVGAITSGTWTANALDWAYIPFPSGAIFFIISGTCPSGTTDVTSTYSSEFPSFTGDICQVD